MLWAYEPYELDVLKTVLPPGYTDLTLKKSNLSNLSSFWAGTQPATEKQQRQCRAVTAQQWRRWQRFVSAAAPITAAPILKLCCIAALFPPQPWLWLHKNWWRLGGLDEPWEGDGWRRLEWDLPEEELKVRIEWKKVFRGSEGWGGEWSRERKRKTK